MNSTHPPRRHHYNVGVIAGSLWQAHDRGAADNGVSAPAQRVGGSGDTRS